MTAGERAWRARHRLRAPGSGQWIPQTHSTSHRSALGNTRLLPSVTGSQATIPAPFLETSPSNGIGSTCLSWSLLSGTPARTPGFLLFSLGEITHVQEGKHFCYSQANCTLGVQQAEGGHSTTALLAPRFSSDRSSGYRRKSDKAWLYFRRLQIYSTHSTTASSLGPMVLGGLREQWLALGPVKVQLLMNGVLVE